MVPEFENPPLPVRDLPVVEDALFEPLDERYFTASLLTGAATAVVVVVAAAVAAFFVPVWVSAAATVGVLAGLAVLLFVHRLDIRRRGFLLREHDFTFKRGVLWQRVSSIPFARIQHVRVERGPIERWLGLATIHLQVAGSGIAVAGISPTQADQLKALLVERAGLLADKPFDESASGYQSADR